MLATNRPTNQEMSEEIRLKATIFPSKSIIVLLHIELVGLHYINLITSKTKGKENVSELIDVSERCGSEHKRNEKGQKGKEKRDYN